MKLPSKFPRRQLMGFSLIELIVVVGILGMLAAISVPVTVGVIRANRLTTCASNLTNLLNAARMLSIRSNQPIEMRFFQYADRDTPGGDVGYRACQLWRNGAPTDSMVTFETGVVLSTMTDSTGESWSSILDTTKNVSGAGQLLPDFFKISRALPTVAAKTSFFQFRPNGSTNLPTNQQWTLTLVQESAAKQTDLPPNFVTIAVDPLTGGVRTYSP